MTPRREFRKGAGMWFALGFLGGALLFEFCKWVWCMLKMSSEANERAEEMMARWLEDRRDKNQK